MAAEAHELLEELCEVVRSLRLGMEGDAAERLASLLSRLHELLAHPAAARELERLLPLLASMLAAQERSDALLLADQLEHELAPQLGLFGSPQ